MIMYQKKKISMICLWISLPSFHSLLLFFSLFMMKNLHPSPSRFKLDFPPRRRKRFFIWYCSMSQLLFGIIKQKELARRRKREREREEGRNYWLEIRKENTRRREWTSYKKKKWNVVEKKMKKMNPREGEAGISSPKRSGEGTRSELLVLINCQMRQFAQN